MIIKIEGDVLDNLSKTERQIVQFINEHEHDLAKMSIVDIAFETFSSPSTVSRAIRKCGINGFNELRYKLTLPNKNRELTSINEIMNKSLVEATEVLQRISLTNVLAVVNEIRAAKDQKIYIFSRGLTEQVVKEFSLKLELLNYDITQTGDPNIIINLSKRLKKNQLVIIVSLNGQTPELIEAAQNAYLAGAKTIVICCSDKSPLLQYAYRYLVGYRYENISIKEFEVTSRVPLFIISRILVDYLVEQENIEAADK